jgi:iron complex transport system substrate-binding protein
VLGVLAAGVAPASPARIVTLAPNLAELAWAAGAGDALVGTVEWSDWPPAVQSLPRVGDAFRLDFEALAELAPDLVLAWGGGNPPHMIDRLRQAGYRVEVLAPRHLEDIPAHIEEIGRLAGTDAAAAAAASRLRTELDELRAAQRGKPPLRVFYQVSWRPLYTVGGDQFISQAIELCQGENVFAGLAELAPVVSLEAVLARDPQVILTAAGPADARDSLRGWHEWPRLAAVRADNLFLVPGDLIARAGPRLVRGARELCVVMDEARRRAAALSPEPPG